MTAQNNDTRLIVQFCNHKMSGYQNRLTPLHGFSEDWCIPMESCTRFSPTIRDFYEMSHPSSAAKVNDPSNRPAESVVFRHTKNEGTSLNDVPSAITGLLLYEDFSFQKGNQDPSNRDQQNQDRYQAYHSVS